MTSECTHWLRVNYTDKRHCLKNSIDEKFVMTRFPGSKSLVEIDGSMYLGFWNYWAIQHAFLHACDSFTKRMIDPYALHVTISMQHSLQDVQRYFNRFGRVHCVVDHRSTRARYVFVNFMDREAALRALKVGATHVIRGYRVKIRSKVLSAAEPHAPKPYSPARQSM